MNALIKTRYNYPEWNHDVFDSLYDGIFNTSFKTKSQAHFSSLEEDSHFLLTADLPGLKKDDLVLEVKNQELLISAKLSEESEEKGFRRRSFQNLNHRFTIPDNVDLEKIEANLEDGVLDIILPKQAPKAGKVISINEKKSSFLSSLKSKKERT